MKKYSILYTVALLFLFNLSFSQVGIGTSTPNTVAALDLDVSAATSKKGLLLPRVSLLHNKDVTTIPSPASGLVVFNLADAQLGTDATSAVTKNMFYFWNGTSWTDIATLDVVKTELFPQVFQIVGNQNQATGTVASAPIVVNWQNTSASQFSTIHINSGNNVTLNTDNTLTVNKTGRYEISGTISMNPGVNLAASANLELTIEYSTNGTTWTTIGKSTAVWGNNAGGNSQSIIVSPMVVELAKDAKIRCVVFSTEGTHGTDSKIYVGGGMTYSRSLKIQYLN